MAQVVKARSAGESVLITLVGKEAVAAGAWVSRSPTSCTQNLFPKSWPLGLVMRKVENLENVCKGNIGSVCKINVFISFISAPSEVRPFSICRGRTSLKIGAL